MPDQLTTTIFSTTTVTSTRTLTRTILSILPSATSSITLHTDSNNILRKPDEPNGTLYPYRSSLVLAILFTILYFIATLHHGYLSICAPRRPETIQKHRYTIPLFVAAILSTIGYLTRSISVQKSNNSNLGLFTISAGLILISPIFLCATLYLLLVRFISRCLPPPALATPTTPRSVTRSRSTRRDIQTFLFLPPTTLSTLLIISDILSFLTQSVGAILASSTHWTESNLSRGTNILLVGLALQLATFLLFLLTLHLFCTRVRNSPNHGFNPCIMKVIVAMWIAGGFVLIRTLFRLVEFATGLSGYAYRHEWCLYTFDALPLWVALMVLGWWHPVKWVQDRLVVTSTTSDTVATTTTKGRAEKAETVEFVLLRDPIVGSGGAGAGAGVSQGNVGQGERGGHQQPKNTHTRKRSWISSST